MTNVYVAREDVDDDKHVVGYFTSLELAQQACQTKTDKGLIWWLNGVGMWRAYGFDVIEYPLDITLKEAFG